jgi:phage terminase small subunit
MTAARIAQLRALGSELGLDPSSRARAGFQIKNPWEESKFAGLIGRKPWEACPADEFLD